MGKGYSKEEIIIAQAGNSGGVSNDTSKYHLTEVIGIMAVGFCIVFILWCACVRSRKALRVQVRREVAKSFEELRRNESAV